MIPESERRLHEFRALRSLAWEQFEEDVNQLRHDLTERTIVDRIKDRASLELNEAADYAKDVAAANKPVVIGTVVLLLGWLLRGPIGAAWDALFGGDDDAEEDAEQEGRESVDADKGDAS